MRKTITFFRLRLFAFVVTFLGLSANSAWAGTITLTLNTTNVGAGSYSTTDAAGAVSPYSDYKWSNWQGGSNAITVRGNQTAATGNFSVHNSVAIPGNITSVKITAASTIGVDGSTSNRLNSSKINLITGTSDITGTTGGSTGTATTGTGGNITWTLSGTDTFFRIQFLNGATTGTATITSIVITYTSTPSITTPSPTSISGFTTTTGTASTSQTFTVGGSNLTANLVVTAPTDYEVRQSGTGSFGSSVSFAPSSGTVATKTIEVRIAASAGVGTPSGNVACTSTDATTKNVGVSGTVNAASSPVITASGTINAFANTAINATSADQSYTVEGSNLAGDIVITPPAGFQISTTSGLSFSPTNPITLTKDVSGNVSQTTIYVRFAPTAVQAYSGNITHASTDATTVNKALSGTGVKAEPSSHATVFTATTNSTSQITIAWTDATGGQVPDGYLIKASTGTPTAPADGTAEVDAALVKNIAQGTQTVVFTGLTASTTYNFSIWPYTNSGAAIDYKIGSQPTASATTETPLGVPVASTATGVSASGFSANWGAATSATGYDVNVYTKSTGTASTATEILNNPGSDQNAPIGWTYNNISSASYIKMIMSTSSVVSPAIDLTNYATARLNARVGSFGTISGNSAQITIDVSTDGGTNWTIVATPAGTTGTNNGSEMNEVNLDDYAGMPTVTIRFRTLSALGTSTTDNSSSTARGARLSLITLSGKAITTTNTTIAGSPFTVTETTKTVSGLNPATTYYYTVVAKKANETSSASNEISVTTDNHLSVSGDVNASTLPVCPTCDIEITNGNTLNINESKQFNSVTVAPGAKLTLENGFTLTAPITLQSNATGTATLLDSYATPTVTATVQQYVTAGRNWYVATPIQSSNVTEFGLGDSVVHFNETLKKWEKVTGALTAGRGYIQTAVNGHGSTGVVDFTGTTNSGDVTVSLTRSGTTQAGFNLVGNPYPSYLDWEAVAAANTDVLPTAWFRTKKADNSYVFATVNVADVTPVIVNNGANTTVTSYIPPMQAYWVRVDAGKASTNYTVSNSMRHHADDNGNKLKAPKSNSQQLLRLNVTGAGGSDEAVVYFSPKATNSLDRYDSPKMSNNNVAIPEIYTLAGAEKLVINGMGELNPSVELPLGFTTGQTNNFSISALELKNFASDIQVILKDKLQNTEFDLTSGQAYGFNSGVVNDASRFSIIFKTAGSVTGLDNKKLNTNTSVFVNANGELVVKTSALLGANARVDVFNAIGQHVGSKTMTSDMTISNVARTAGVYWVKLTNDGESITRKVVVK